MPISNEAMKARAAAFAKKFAKTTSEKRHDQNFMRDFVDIFGINPTRIEWQAPVKAGAKKPTTNWIDGLLPGMALFEMKSAGKDMDNAYTQAADYTALLRDKDLPRLIIVSDFANIHVYNRETGDKAEIHLADLPQNLGPLLPLAGFEAVAIANQDKIQRDAAEKIGNLHDTLRANGYSGEPLEGYLTRLLFCLFADDTGLFGDNGRFLDFLVNHTKPDGSDLHGQLVALFTTLNTPTDQRPRNLPERLQPFPYVNGSVFQGELPVYYFDEMARDQLIALAQEDWRDIDPGIFGSLFQHIMHFDGEASGSQRKKGAPNKRREFGAHYTSNGNILKVINPLFMDGLRREFKAARNNHVLLAALHDKLARMQFFDPACGCGNFLVVAYRELRLLELDIIEALHGKTANQSDIAFLVRLDVDQFHGIEIDSTAARIATVALWLTDHQMNLKAQRLGGYLHRLPLTKRPNIVNGNALRMAWADVLPPGKCNVVMGNPPFIGAKFMNDEQRADAETVFAPVKNGGLLDYVAAWHVTAARYIQGTTIPVAFVSTNSITQGEQVGVLWPYLLNQGIHIRFAHRTFRWSNEGRGVAAVHCVIIGFGLEADKAPVIYDYGDDIAGEPHAIAAKNINPYLVDAGNAVLQRRGKPLCGVPEMGIGNKPIDGGFYLFTPEEKAEFIAAEPGSAPFFRPWLGAEEFLNGIERWCLWLGDASAADLARLPKCRERIAAVQALRLTSKSAPTRKLADFPSRFHVEFMPDAEYLVVPEVSSERRRFIPIGFIQPETLSSNLLRIVPKATLYHFGILSSTLHNAWMRTVCGRMKSDYRYSIGIVYNNYPWPTPTPAQTKAIETAAQAVLDARATQPDATLAQLYNTPMTTAPLVKAHQKLDAAVDAAYGYTGINDDAARVAFLFTRYQALVQAAADKAKETEGSKA
ncbi:MAG: N-6 DNA methylase [Gammaproteobacteria bacterium]|nr:N-6 DNA methylase [Gammaproteobacteria bacterium]